MNNPVVLITGALTGIGRSTAVAFAKEGARVVVAGRRDAEGKALEAELRGLGAEASFIKADVRHDDEVRDLVDQTVARFGRLDAAVNTAGTEGKPGPVAEQTAETYAATFDTNVLGTLLSMKHELRVMQPQGRGSIVNISSTFHVWARRGSRCLGLCREQARRGRHDEVRGARSGQIRRARQRCGARSDRHRYAHSLHWNPGKEGGDDERGAARAPRRAGRDRPCCGLPCFRPCIIRDRPDSCR